MFITKYYLQLDENNIIRDAITYPYGNYVEYETPYPLPIGVCGGWFKFENGEIVEYPELKPKALAEEELENLKIELSQTNATLDSILTEVIPSLMALIQ